MSSSSRSSQPRTAAPRKLARDYSRAQQLHRAPNTQTTEDRQQSSSDLHRRRGRSPSQKATPAAPPAPQRRQQAPKPNLHYIHAADRGFPILPLPKQQSEGEEPADLAAARWIARGRPKVALSTVDGERIRLQGAVDYHRLSRLINFNKFLASSTTKFQSL
jgi:hypothetical protein